MYTEECPRCGKTFERETQEAARRSTAAHMSSKVDDEHQGISYPKAEGLIGNSKTSPSDDDSPDIKDASNDTDPQPAVTDGGGLGLSGPTAATTPSDDVDGDPEPDKDDREETVDCPHCGEDTELRPEDHGQGQTYRCTECGGRYKWT